MGKEIERKYLVNHEKWNSLKKEEGILLKQGYIHSSIEKTIRVRISNGKGYLTIKGATVEISRSEFEYEIPENEANELLNQFAENEIKKFRYAIKLGNHTWEVDVFLGENEGLIIAEVELQSEDEELELPDWVGTEVSLDSRYFNANLIENPYKLWKNDIEIAN